MVLANLSDTDQSVTLTLSDRCPTAYVMQDGRELKKLDGVLRFGRFDMIRLVCK